MPALPSQEGMLRQPQGRGVWLQHGHMHFYTWHALALSQGLSPVKACSGALRTLGRQQ